MPSDPLAARPSGAPVRVLHVITGLDVGGTERSLLALLGAWRGSSVESAVLALRPGGALLRHVDALGVPTLTAGMTRAIPRPTHLGRLARHARAWRPDLVQGWLVHGNLGAVIAAYAAAQRTRRPPVIWGVRAGLADLTNEPRTTRLALRTSVSLAHRAARILYNSARSAAEHEAIGYPADRRAVIPNGFDLERFHPDPAARRAVRAELGLTDATPLVGMIARYHPQKDHATFVRAAERLSAIRADVRFVLVGPNVDPQNAALVRAVAAAGLSDRVRLLGHRDDTPRVYAALDVAALCSRTEAFPNVVGEAMASGVVPVATDVGDVRTLVGDTGVVVPVGDAAALAAAWTAVIALSPDERAARGRRARARVGSRFALSVTAARFEALYRDVLA